MSHQLSSTDFRAVHDGCVAIDRFASPVPAAVDILTMRARGVD